MPLGRRSRFCGEHADGRRSAETGASHRDTAVTFFTRVPRTLLVPANVSEPLLHRGTLGRGENLAKLLLGLVGASQGSIQGEKLMKAGVLLGSRRPRPTARICLPARKKTSRRSSSSAVPGGFMMWKGSCMIAACSSPGVRSSAFQNGLRMSIEKTWMAAFCSAVSVSGQPRRVSSLRPSPILSGSPASRLLTMVTNL